MFDIIGDIHGQHDKLVELLAHLDYREIDGEQKECAAIFRQPAGFTSGPYGRRADAAILGVVGSRAPTMRIDN